MLTGVGRAHGAAFSASGTWDAGTRRKRRTRARWPRRLAWAVALAVALAALFALSLSQSLTTRAQLRRGIEHPAGAGDAAREPAAARLVDLGRLLLHHRTARVRARGGRPGPVAGRGAHLRRAHLHAHAWRWRGCSPGGARPAGPGCAGPGSRSPSCSRRPSSAAPRSSSRTPTTSAPRSRSCSCCCCWTGGRGATTVTAPRWYVPGRGLRAAGLDPGRRRAVPGGGHGSDRGGLRAPPRDRPGRSSPAGSSCAGTGCWRRPR